MKTARTDDPKAAPARGLGETLIAVRDEQSLSRVVRQSLKEALLSDDARTELLLLPRGQKQRRKIVAT